MTQTQAKQAHRCLTVALWLMVAVGVAALVVGVML